MQKRFGFLILAAVFLAVLPWTARAQYEIQDEYTVPTDETHSLEGVVTKFSSRSITLQTESGSQESFRIDSGSTTAYRQGESVGLDQIQLGDSVRLRLSKKSSVKSVEIL